MAALNFKYHIIKMVSQPHGDPFVTSRTIQIIACNISKNEEEKK